MAKLFVRRRTVYASLLLAIASQFSATFANAELGGTARSVQNDGTRMKAHIATTAMGSYSRHALTRDNGGTVHEFTNASGQVFAVTWSGPGKPDLRALLGNYFAPFQSGEPAPHGRRMQGLRRPGRVNQSDLQIETGGHMGWFHGVAFIPSLAPAGFSSATLAEGQ